MAAGEQRKVYQRQPARAVLVDLSPPMDSYTCLNIHEALWSTLSLVLQHQGTPCLSHLSLILLGNYPKCLFPMQHIRSNSQRVTVALKSLATEAQSLTRSSSSSSLPDSCLVDGLQEALLQFHRLTQNSKQVLGAPSQVEVTLVTGRREESVRETLLRVSDHISLEQLRKICVLCVSDPDRVALRPGTHGGLLVGSTGAGEGEEAQSETGGGQLGLSQMNYSQVDLGMSMMDIVHSDNDTLSLSNVFKTWLLDCSTDTQHLVLTLPPSSLGDPPLTLKCDLQDRIIDPHSLVNAGEKFALNAGSTPVVRPHKMSNAALGPQLPVYKLRAEALIEPEGVCESVLFGMPLSLRPTACWRLDWEELERNQQLFTALCRSLQQKGAYLLTVAEDSELNPRFLILPSPPPSLSLLIKSIAVQELMMPQEVPLPDDQPSQEATSAVEHCLHTMERKTVYNPLTVSSNLYQSLSVNKRGTLSKGHRVFSSGPQQQQQQQQVMGGYSSGRDSRSLGPRKQHSTGMTYSRK